MTMPASADAPLPGAALELSLHYEDGRQESCQLTLPVVIGRDPDCGLRLRSWRVARRHASLEWRHAGVWLLDGGTFAGTWHNQHRLSGGVALAVGDELVVGPCLIRVERLPSVAGAAAPAAEVPAGGLAGTRPPAAPLAGTETRGDAVAVPQRAASPANAAHPAVPAGRLDPTGPVPAGPVEMAQTVRHRRRLHAALLQALDLRRHDIAGLSDEALKAEAQRVLHDLLAQDTQLPDDADRPRLLREVVDEAVGLGVLEPLLADPEVTEIMVNCHDEIYVERAGRLCLLGASFSGEAAVRGVIDRIVAPLGRRVDDSAPMVDARLPDGSRVNAVVPPIALRGSALTVRKFPGRRLRMADLLRGAALSPVMAEFLLACVRHRKNVLVSGGTGSGKTTLLNILADGIPAGERVITIEDAAELKLQHAHCVALESRPANQEGRGRVEIRDLVRNALRMRPDRIVVGECRGAEAFDMLAAMNTGHEGSLSTLHANSPRDALARLETMMLMAGLALPLAAVREHVASAIHVLVQQARLADGSRRVTDIVEVTGVESGVVQLQPLFRQLRSAPGRYTACGALPECFMDAAGHCSLPLAWFQPGECGPGDDGLRAMASAPDPSSAGGRGAAALGADARGTGGYGAEAPRFSTEARP